MQTTKSVFEKQIVGLKNLGYDFITYEQLQKFKISNQGLYEIVELTKVKRDKNHMVYQIAVNQNLRVSNDLMKGTYGYLLPQKAATRAEVAAMIMNYCEKQ